jgi:hypothetical protein
MTLGSTTRPHRRARRKHKHHIGEVELVPPLALLIVGAQRAGEGDIPASSMQMHLDLGAPHHREGIARERRDHLEQPPPQHEVGMDP